MIARFIIAMVLAAAAVSSATPATAAMTRWNPDSAVADAQRDIAAGQLRFAYIGGRASYPPGVPSEGGAWLYVRRHYPRLEVGPQGCAQDGHFPERKQYAQRYNQVMWSYVSKHR